MFHIINVGMNSSLLQQLDALRPVYPEAANRMQIVNALIAETHARVFGNRDIVEPKADNDARAPAAASVA